MSHISMEMDRRPSDLNYQFSRYETNWKCQWNFFSSFFMTLPKCHTISTKIQLYSLRNVITISTSEFGSCTVHLMKLPNMPLHAPPPSPTNPYIPEHLIFQVTFANKQIQTDRSEQAGRPSILVRPDDQSMVWVPAIAKLLYRSIFNHPAVEEDSIPIVGRNFYRPHSRHHRFLCKFMVTMCIQVIGFCLVVPPL